MKSVSSPKTIALAIFILFFSALPAWAQNDTQIHQGFYFQNADDVTITQTINGHAFVSGGTVTFDGTVNGDLFVAGGMVTIRGQISDDLRVAGGFVIIEGEVGKNVLAAGGNIKVGPTAVIGGSILALGGNVNLDGTIQKDVHIYAENATILGQIGGKTNAVVTKLNINDGASLLGNLNYTAPTKATIAKEASISGTVKRTAPPAIEKPAKPRFAFGFTIFSYLSMLLIGLILVKLAPRQTQALGRLVEERPWKNLLWGLLFLVITPLAIFILAISIIGLPLAVISGGVYVLTIVLTSLVTGLWIGRRIFRTLTFKKNLYLQLATGLLVIQLIFALPIIGFFVRLLSIFIGLGAEIALARAALKKLQH